MYKESSCPISIMIITILGIVSLTGDNSFAQGIRTVLGNHECHGHSTDWHQHPDDGYVFAQFKIVQWCPDVTYSVDIVNDSNETLRFLHRYFSNYTCITQGPKTIAVEETITHSVKVTGGWEIGGKLEWAAGNLFAKCKTEAHAKVDHNKENSDTKEVKVTEKITYSIPPARKIEYWYDVIKHDKSFQMVAADAEFKCRDHHTNRISNWTCNKDIIEGVGVGHSDADEGVRTVGGELCDCSNDAGYVREKPGK